MNNLISEFQLRYPELVKQMKEADHHYSESHLNPYHLEGDVWTHTNMVALEAERACLPRPLKIACLLHDIGKPACRMENHDKQRVNFIGHEPYSAFMAVDILRDFDLTEEEIIHCFQLIAMHTEPFKLTDQALQNRCIHNGLFYFDLLKISKCDKDGRFNHPVAPRELGKKYETLDHKTKFDSEVIVLVGLPASGKSTIRAEYPDYEVLSWDDTMCSMYEGSTYGEKFKNASDREVKKVIQERKNSLIKEGKNVIIDMTNLSRKTRRRNLAGFEKYNKKAIVALCGLEELKRRNEMRKEVGKYIEWEVYDRMMKTFYPPLLDEFHEVDWRLS